MNSRNSRIIEQLAALPREQIAKDLEAVRAEMQRLEIEEALLGQVLRLQQWADDGVPGAQDALAGLAADESPAKERSIIANVATVLRQGQGHWYEPPQIERTLQDRGISATGNNVRVALRRLLDRGVVERNGRAYRIASSHAGPSG